MADIKSVSERSRNMSAIKSHDTKPEIFIRRQLYAKGIHYYKNYRKVEGCPDIYVSRYKTAVFIHGCFWHRHMGCKYSYMPKSRQEFWKEKFDHNVERDQKVQMQLRNEGIRYLIVWECTIRKMESDIIYNQKVIDKIINFICGEEAFEEL